MRIRIGSLESFDHLGVQGHMLSAQKPTGGCVMRGMKHIRLVAVTALMLSWALVHAVLAATPDSMSPWSLQLSPQGRFQALQDFQGQAVLDKETGLVWEKSPSTTPLVWEEARGFPQGCANKNVGGRKGWRLPSFAELASLVDPN